MKRFIGMMVVFALVLTLFSACSSGGSSSRSGGYDVAYGLINYDDFLKLTNCDWVNDPDKQNWISIEYGIYYNIVDDEIDVERTLSEMLKKLATCTELSLANGTLKVAMDVSWSEVQKLVKDKGTISTVDSDFKNTLDTIGANFQYLRLADTDDEVLWIGVELSIYDILSDYM